MKYLINTSIKKNIIIDLFYKKYYLFVNVSLHKKRKKKGETQYIFNVFYLLIIYNNKNII